jgi:hypothetical protein
MPPTIAREKAGSRISEISYGGRKLDGYFIPHRELAKGEQLVIKTSAAAASK